MLLQKRLSLTACTSLVARLCLADEVYDRYSYCTRWYGSVRGSIDLEDVVQENNYNGTIFCPDSYDFPSATTALAGAIMDVCPPLSYIDDTNAIEVRLSFSDASSVLSGPIDNLDLENILITNGSVTHAFENNALPALLQPDPQRSTRFIPSWVVNGTQYALSQAPDEDDDSMGVYLDCDYEGSYGYCGGYEDIHDGGCWSRQSFVFNMRSHLNFTIRFSDSQASFEIWAAQELYNAQQPTGKNAKAYISFEGTRQLPSIVDYQFWENSPQTDYEHEQAFLSTRQFLKWVADEKGMPLLLNNTKNGEWFDAGNGTFKAENGADSIVSRLGSVPTAFAALLVTLAWLML